MKGAEILESILGLFIIIILGTSLWPSVIGLLFSENIPYNYKLIIYVGIISISIIGSVTLIYEIFKKI